MDQPSLSGTLSAAQPSPTRRDLHVSGFGVFLGATLFACSLTPSLVPREAAIQGVLGGALFAFGFGFAIAVRSLWRWLQLPELRLRPGKRAALGAAVLGLAFAGYALSQATEWQNAVRTMMDLPPYDSTHRLTILTLAVLTATLLLVVGYVIALLVRFAARRLEHVVSERVAILLAVAFASILVASIVNGVLVRYALTVIDASYAQLDRLMEPETERPSNPMRTGSADSLVDWAALGREGRRFVDGLTTEDALNAFWQGPVTTPRRVYVGLGAEPDAAARAELALAELQRIGGFDREVLVIAIPTGTGFLDEAAISTLEYLTRGDVATVALQYSYLQSPFSLIFEPEYGQGTARELFRAVYSHWTMLPEDERPRLYLYGLSLGALSSERSVRFYEMLGDPIQGALWAGPPFLGPIHSGVTRNREPGSPAWKPVFEDGSLVRFMNRSGLENGAEGWGPLRIIYLQHASDPIVFFSFTMLWRRPDWLKPPRGEDVSPAITWFPVVTALQVAADMALSNNVPLGHGHQYAPESYLEAWTALIEPNVTAVDLDRLEEMFGG